MASRLWVPAACGPLAVCGGVRVVVGGPVLFAVDGRSPALAT
jgi:hypothetical protein